jgi:hypothetical protein
MTILLVGSATESTGVTAVSAGVDAVSAGVVVAVSAGTGVCVESVTFVESAGTGGRFSGALGLLLEESLPQALRTRSAAAERVRLVLALIFIVTSLGFMHLKTILERVKKQTSGHDLRIHG